MTFEITEEMLRAGVGAIYAQDHEYANQQPDSVLTRIATSVFLAMEAVRPQGDDGTSRPWKI